MVIAPARRAGDPGSIPGPGENFSLKLLILFSHLHLGFPKVFLPVSLSVPSSILHT